MYNFAIYLNAQCCYIPNPIHTPEPSTEMEQIRPMEEQKKRKKKDKKPDTCRGAKQRDWGDLPPGVPST